MKQAASTETAKKRVKSKYPGAYEAYRLPPKRNSQITPAIAVGLTLLGKGASFAAAWKDAARKL